MAFLKKFSDFPMHRPPVAQQHRGSPPREMPVPVTLDKPRLVGKLLRREHIGEFLGKFRQFGMTRPAVARADALTDITAPYASGTREQRVFLRAERSLALGNE